MNSSLKYGLEKLEMIGTTNQASGLISVLGIKNADLSAEEFIAVENAKRYNVDYIYFRRFAKRPSVAQVYIYDFTENLGVQDKELTDIHKQLYSSALVPMFFVFTKKDIRIFNCFERPSDGKVLIYKPLSIIKLASDLTGFIDQKQKEEFEAFSGKSIDNGTFWENSKYSKYFKFSNSAYERLLTELKQALGDIIKRKILPAGIAKKLMVTSILIRYLEERQDEHGKRVFPDNFFNKFVKGGQKFTDVFAKKGAYIDLLDFLAEHFNGGIFQIDEKEREFLKTADLTRFGLFLEGKSQGIQLVLWELYSFNDLPVELISNIYEEFLGKQPGVVYTPPFLVSFLLDEAMPLSSDVTDFKILDPACGSGVFLVGAYRRLIYRWRKKNNWKRPTLSVLKKLLRENIYGVELNQDAADLTIFSLCLALCDELTPLQIWEDLKFDNLHERNILNDDFFNILLSNQLANDFDLIIGNPPFEAKLTSAAKKIEEASFRERQSSAIQEQIKGKTKYIKLPDNQISLLFLEQSIKLCKTQGLVCLIQPSGPLLYNSSSFQFRRVLFEKYYIPQIVDFTHISRILFGKNGDVATAAIFIKNEKAKDKGVLHITVRRNKAHKEKLFFELDTYDFHTVPRELALNDSLIWKANFLGGFRIHQLIKRLSEFPTLKEYLEVNKKNGWYVSEGFTGATRGDLKKLKNLEDTEDIEMFKESEDKLLAPFISRKRFLPTDALTIYGIDESQIEKTAPVKYFHSKGDKNIYEPPHILIKELIVDNIIPIDISFQSLSFQRRIIGIHAPFEDLDKLFDLLGRFSNSMYPFYIAGTSGQYLVNKSSAIYKQDIENLPFPDNEDEIEISVFEKILIEDFKKYLLEYRRNGETSKIALQNTSETELNRFGEIYTKVLSTVYSSIKPYQFIETDSYICYPFYFGDAPDIDFSNLEEFESHIEKLVKRNFNVNLRVVRILRIYEGNIIYLIKPKKLRYWLESIALRDADETFSDLRKQGY